MPWQASQFWVDYSDGFVRRGLPGALIGVLSGGPSSALVTVVAVLLLLAAVVGWCSIAWRLAVECDRSASWLVVALVLASPFTLSLLVRDIGRYDTIGVITVALLLLVGRCPAPRTAVGLASVLVAVATASEEFLFAFTAPAALTVLWATGLLRPANCLAVAMPGAVLAFASVVIQPDRDWLIAAADEAARGGAGTDRYGENAIAALSQTTGQALENLAETSPTTIGIGIVVFGGCLLATTAVLWLLLDRPAPYIVWGMTCLYCAAALGLSLVGIDYGRWWALAFASVLTTLVAATGRSRPTAGPPRRAVVAVAAVVLAIGTVGQQFPIYPSWDPSAATNVVLVGGTDRTPQDET